MINNCVAFYYNIVFAFGIEHIQCVIVFGINRLPRVDNLCGAWIVKTIKATNILAPLPGKAIIDFKSINIFFLDVKIVWEDADPEEN